MRRAIPMLAAAVLVLVAFPSCSGSVPDDCYTPSAGWIEDLRGSFKSEYRNLPVTASGYRRASASQGGAYYVVLQLGGLEKLEGMNVAFGTFDSPAEAHIGHVWTVNAWAYTVTGEGATWGFPPGSSPSTWISVAGPCIPSGLAPL